MWAVARAYGLSVADLVEWNQLDDPDRIIAGHRLLLDGTEPFGADDQPSTSESAAGTNTYEVKSALRGQAGLAASY